MQIKKGFTLLEILLVIAVIGILSTIVIVALNPTRQLSQARNAVRRSNINTISSALNQYFIDTQSYPSTLTYWYQDICPSSGGSNCVDINVLVPDYIASIPVDPNGNQYQIALNVFDNRPALRARNAELNQRIAINPLQSGKRDTSFNIGIGFNGNVNSIVQQSDGRLVIGGSFTTYQGVSANGIIRLNLDGSRDTSFNIGTGFDVGVSSIVQQSDGRLVIGGGFTMYQGISASRIIRLNLDGSRDTNFNIGTGFTDNGVNDIVQQGDGKLVAVGGFTAYQGVGANRIIRLNTDGSRDNTFNIGTGFTAIGGGTVNDILQQGDGKFVLVGLFTSYQGVGANRIIRLNTDGSRDNSFNIGTGFSNTVDSIMQQSDDKFIVGGQFVMYQGGFFGNYFLRLNNNASVDSLFNHGSAFDSPVTSIIQQSDGKVVVGGWFTDYNGTSANRIIRMNNDGLVDVDFEIGTGFNDRVFRVFQQSDGKILVGGIFGTYQDEPVPYLIRLLP